MGNKALYQSYALAIAKLSSGTTFRLRDLQPNPPALVGRMVYENRKSLGIVRLLNAYGDCNLWRKI